MRIGDQVGKTVVHVERVSGEGNDDGLQTHEDHHSGSDAGEPGGTLSCFRPEGAGILIARVTLATSVRPGADARQALRPRLFRSLVPGCAGSARPPIWRARSRLPWRSPSSCSAVRSGRCSMSERARGAGSRVLHRLRPRARYAGVDSSRWAVARWGRRRNLRLGSIDALDRARPGRPLRPDRGLGHAPLSPHAGAARGIAQIAALLDGVAFLPTFTAADEIEGDRAHFQRRSARPVPRASSGRPGWCRSGCTHGRVKDAARELGEAGTSP